MGFVEAKSDTSMFVCHRGVDIAFLLLYINNIVLTALSSELLQHTSTTLQQQFMMEDLGPLHHSLCISIETWSGNLFIHQRQYASNILERAGMTDCNPCSTPVDTQANVSSDMGAPSATRLPTAA
jgi:hypothetical protein